MTKTPFILLFLGFLTGCSTFSPPSYVPEYENVAKLKSLNVANIAVDDFTGPNEFDSQCRAVGNITPPRNSSFSEYVRDAFIEELKLANSYNGDQSPLIRLSGRIETLSFSSTTSILLGRWKIRLTLMSSNGQSLTTEKQYEYDGAYWPEVACTKVADAFVVLIQNAIGEIVYSSEFETLLN